MRDFQARPCAVCGSRAAEEVYGQRLLPAFDFPGFEQHVQLCQDCGFVFVSPAPSSELLSRYYGTLSNYENPHNAGRPTEEDMRKHDRALGLIRRTHGARPPGRALDIGCAVPYLLGRLSHEGWSVAGTDPSPRVADIGRELYGVEVRTGFYEPAMFDEHAFDVVVLSHVVEHLLKPKDVLAGVRMSLQPDGFVYIEVPNLLEPAVPFGYFTFEHVNYFTPRTLAGLLGNAGFEPIEITTFDNADGTWPFYPVISGLFRPTPTPARQRTDAAAARRAVADYRATSAQEGARLKSRVASVLRGVTPGRLAIWGAGIHTNQLITLAGLDPGLIACVFDNDPKKHGRSLLGRPVQALPLDPRDAATDVDAILISSRASEAAIYDQIKGLEEFGIRVHRLYGNAPSEGLRERP